MLVGAVDGCRRLRPLNLHACQRLGRVLFESTQLVEGRGLLVEARVRLVAQPDDLGVPCTRLLFGVGGRVVELLLDREGLVEVLARGLQRLLELDGRGVAELSLREPELLIAGLDGVVGRDQRGGGAAVQLLDADLVDGPTRAGAATDPLAAASDHHDDDEDRHSSDHEEDHQAEREAASGRGGARSRPAAGGILQPVGGGIHRSQPVFGRELRLDELLLDRAELLLGNGSGRIARQVELARPGRHREKVLRRSESVRLGGRVRPVRGVRGIGELVDVDDPEVEPRVGLQLLEPGLRLRFLAGGERIDVIEDVARTEGDGCRGRRHSGRADDQHRGDDGAESGRERRCPSRTHRSPPRGSRSAGPEDRVYARAGARR